MVSFRLIACAAALATVPVTGTAAETVDRITVEGERRTAEGAATQDKIDRLADSTEALLAEYRDLAKLVDGLKVYNELLQRQVDNQAAEIAALSESIESVSLIERQITPLMIRMIDALARFIEIDTPFLMAERTTRVSGLREMMLRADVTVAEKFRRVVEAYQIENEYGRTIEAYKGSLEVDGKLREVDFLRIGRVVLLYQTAAATHTGIWRRDGRSWDSLSADRYRREVAQGLRIARKRIAPDLIILPVPAAGGLPQ